MDRRRFLQVGMGGILGALGSRWLAGFPTVRAAPTPKAKAIVVLWMNGGPSHVDTFDPKPGAKGGGPFKDIATRAAGVRLCEHLPRLADVADKIAIVRGLSTREGNHVRAHHLVHTGYSPSPTVAHPSLGAWVSEELGDRKAPLPAFVSIRGPSAAAGFLGPEHGPFVVADPKEPPRDVGQAPGVDVDRFHRRQAALAALELDFARATGDRKVTSRDEVYAQAVRLMEAPGLRAFDLSSESAATRGSYGDSDFGRGCLLARRLVEAGVRYVEVTLDGWDTHKDNFNRTKALMADLDPAFAALVSDLGARDLLSSTLVLCLGEFGRTPAINANEGRDHHPQAWSCAVAGGGLRGGLAHGETDGDGDKVVKDGVTVADLHATLLGQLGVDPDKELQTPLGRPITITQSGRPIAPLVAT